MTFKSPDDAVFRKKYNYFKSLLANNNQALTLINDLENIVLEHKPFDYDDVLRQCEQLVKTVYEIVEDVNAVSRGKFEDLFVAAERIGVSVLREFTHRKRIEKTTWTLPLASLSHENKSQVGNKAANLAEISNRANLPTPRGFSITAFACHQFFKASGLYELIREEMKGLDVKDGESLENTCSRIQKMVMDAPLPDGVHNAIQKELKTLTDEFGDHIRMAVRSSATGEDSQHASFAGQHSSVLNVLPRDILRAYKEVVASTFNPRAVFYRRKKGYRDLDVLMSVLCLMMIDARASGCLYTIDPSDPMNDDIFINANWGLGVSVVDGSVPTDYWQISKESRRVVIQDIPVKIEMHVMRGEYGLTKVPVPPEKQKEPCLSAEELKRLVEYGIKLENHFGEPLDVEWAVDQAGEMFVLQARPLQRVKQSGKADCQHENIDDHAHEMLMSAGMTASPGSAWGPAYILEEENGLSDVPQGSVLVTRQTSPDYVAAMSRICGIITDVGSVTGHMASVAREFGIPALVGTGIGTATLKPGEIITLDASRRHVFRGKVESVLNKRPPVNLMKDSPVFKLVRQVLKKIIPLHLIDPNSDNFSPRGCLTLHDIVRFAHEMAMREMFMIGEDVKEDQGQYMSIMLNTSLPLNIYVLDLGGGIRGRAGGASVTHDDIVSIPFNALLKGMSHRDVRWTGHRPVIPNAGPGISESDDQAAPEHPGVPHYAIISDEYVNFSLKLGYNFVTIDAFCSNRVNDNYIKLSFKGGAADIGRRKRRAGLVEGVLRKLGFKVEAKVDMLFAEMKKYDLHRTQEKLDIIGRLLGSVRFLDVVLTDDGQLAWYVDEFLRGNYAFKDN